MRTNEPITLSRDCEALQIPSGEKVTLPAGSQVRITQSLGGSYTVVTDRGYMVRIAGKDADAVGQETIATSQAGMSAAVDPAEVEKLVWDQLRTCYDPEIPVNIADLGLIYSCLITSLPDSGNRIEIKMTLTAPGCGMGGALKADVQSKIQSVPGVKEVDVELVWDPPWDQSLMSEAAKLQLGLI
ncbi:MAG: putative Fe-S cluster assembly protein SufT [Candidatus Binatia bacterium]